MLIRECFCSLFGMIWLSQAYSAQVFLSTAAMIGLGYGALLPSFLTIAVKASPVHRRGVATSTFFVFFDSGYGIGAYSLGILAAKTNYHTMFLVGGLITIFTLMIYYVFHHRRQPSGVNSSSTNPEPTKDITVRETIKTLSIECFSVFLFSESIGRTSNRTIGRCALLW